MDHNTGSLVVTVSEQVTSASVDLTKWAVWDGASPPVAVVSSLAGASLVSSASPGAATVGGDGEERAKRCTMLFPVVIWKVNLVVRVSTMKPLRSVGLAGCAG